MIDTLQEPQRALPHSEEAERAVLAAVLLDPPVLAAMAGRLVPEDFYGERHQLVYRAMLDLQVQGTEIDLRTLQARLEQQDQLQQVGGIGYLSGLDLDLPDLGRAETYVEIVKERSLRRRLIRACGEITRDCLDGGLEAQQALGRAEEAILTLGEEAIPRGFEAIGTIAASTLADLEERTPSAMIGVETGFKDFDEMTRGLNRSNLVVIAGRPGMGKCLSADAEIVESDGSVATIEEIVGRKSACLLTLGPDHQFHWVSPSAFVNDGIKPVFEVTTRLGRRIRVTASHPFLTLGGWRPLAELREGDAIGVPRQLDVFGSEELGEPRARLLGYLLGDGGLTGNAARFTNVNAALRSDFTDAVMRFGGVRVTYADSAGARTPTLTVVADEASIQSARDRFADTLEAGLVASGQPARRVAAAVGVSPASITYWRQGRVLPAANTAAALESVVGNLAIAHDARHNGPNAVTRWLAGLGLMGCRAQEKFVPGIVFRAPRQEVRVFLNRLFATDGWVSTLASGQVQVGYCSTSERFARQIQHLLLRFSIIASLKKRQIRYRGTARIAWQLDITEAQSLYRFLEDVGAFGKEVKVRGALLALDRRRRHSNRDVLPAELWSIVDRERRGRPWSSLAGRLGLGRGFNLHVGKRGITRARLRRIASALDSDVLVSLAGSAIYWDRITAIRAVGMERVYDLTVPETHNFVANDICVHNTSFALNIAQYVAVHTRKPVGVFSLEMSKQELVLRILSSQSQVNFSQLRSGHLSQKQWGKVIETVREVSAAPLFIDDSASPTLLEVASKARRLKAEKGLQLIVLDYVQLMQAGGRYENRNLEIGAITRGLKGLAKELDLPVVALSQLSRQPERRGGDHRPQLADLRESGALEQDADLVAFIYRDEVYNKLEDESNKRLAELIIAKHRNGETGTVPLVFFGETTTFKSQSKHEGAPPF